MSENKQRTVFRTEAPTAFAFLSSDLECRRNDGNATEAISIPKKKKRLRDEAKSSPNSDNNRPNSPNCVNPFILVQVRICKDSSLGLETSGGTINIFKFIYIQRM